MAKHMASVSGQEAIPDQGMKFFDFDMDSDASDSGLESII